MIKKQIGTLIESDGIVLLSNKFTGQKFDILGILEDLGNREIGLVINNSFKPKSNGKFDYDLFENVGKANSFINQVSNLFKNHLNSVVEVIIDDNINHSINNVPDVGYKIK